MAVTNQTPAKVSIANGVTTVFPYDFLILDEADLLVTGTLNGVETTYVLNVNYTVSGVGVDSGGNVTFTTGAPASGTYVLRKRNMEAIREDDFQTNGDLIASEVNKNYDRAIMLVQQVLETVGRTIKLPAWLTGLDGTLPAPDPLKPLVWNAAGNGIENGDPLGTGDMLLRPDLASSASGKGQLLVFPAIETLGAVGNGVTLDDLPFALAAALGTVIKLRPGATYYLSQRVNFVTGTRFICDGMCKVKVKTGAGGFNNTTLNGAVKDANAVFFCSGVDDVGVTGVEFVLDGTKEVAVWPIRVSGGTATRGCDFQRIRFNGLSMLAGGYLSLNSIGEGSYRVRDIEGRNCGSALGNAYWTGVPQVTVFDVDNDMVASTPSVPGYAENIRAINVLLTGQAKTDYGQQTDCVNIAGISGTDRKGPTIHGVYADGVGEAVDIFCYGASITGVRAKNVHFYVAKMIHGARDNFIEVVAVESCGQAVVTFAGSSSLVGHTEGNHVVVHSAKGIGDAGDGPTLSDACGVLVQENGGSLATCLPRNNTCDFIRFTGGANTDYAVKDNCSVNNTNNNLIRFDRLPTGMATFGTVVQEANIRVEVRDRARVEVCLTGNQTPLTSGVDTTVQFNDVIVDRQSQFQTGTFKFRPKAPGVYRVKGQVRGAFNASDDVTAKLFKNAAAVAQTASEPVSGALQYTYQIDKMVDIGVNDVGVAAGEIYMQVNIVSAGTITLVDTNSMTFLEVTPAMG